MKVYCGECKHCKHTEDDYSSYEGCKKISRDWSNQKDEYYRILNSSWARPQTMGDCEKINKNHDCSSYEPSFAPGYSDNILNRILGHNLSPLMLWACFGVLLFYILFKLIQKLS